MAGRKSESAEENGGVVNLSQRIVKELEKLINESEQAGDGANRTDKLRLYLNRWTMVGNALSRWQFCYDLLELIEFDGDSRTAASTTNRVKILFNLHCYPHLKKSNLLIEFINKQWASAVRAERVGQLVRLVLEVVLDSNLTATNSLNDVNHFGGISHEAYQRNDHYGRSKGSRAEPVGDDDRQGSRMNEDRLASANVKGKSNLSGQLNLVILIDDRRHPFGYRSFSEVSRLEAREKIRKIFLATFELILHSNRLSLDRVTVFTRLDLIRNEERKCVSV